MSMVVMMSMPTVAVMVVVVVLLAMMVMVMMIVPTAAVMVVRVGLSGVLERRRLVVGMVTVSLCQRRQCEEQDEQEQAQGDCLPVGLLGNGYRLLVHHRQQINWKGNARLISTSQNSLQIARVMNQHSNAHL